MARAKQSDAVDGRRLRSERSRQAIIDAGLELMGGGVLVPTAQQISDAAGVGIRTFFRHFEDMESFFIAIDEQMRDSYESVFLGGNREGSIEDRLLHAVEHHANAFESLTSVILATQAQLWRSAVVRKNYARGQRGLRKDLDDWIPELEKLPKEKREAVDAVASFEMWNRLRDRQGLSKKASIDIVHALLKSLILPN